MRKEKIAISVKPELLEWIDEQMNEKHIFASRSHAFEFAMYKLINES